jgi:hypothetical protein
LHSDDLDWLGRRYTATKIVAPALSSRATEHKQVMFIEPDYFLGRKIWLSRLSAGEGLVAVCGDGGLVDGTAG